MTAVRRRKASTANDFSLAIAPTGTDPGRMSAGDPTVQGLGAQPHFLDAVGPQIVDGDDVYFMVTD
jgi:hypothetical protein